MCIVALTAYVLWPTAALVYTAAWCYGSSKADDIAFALAMHGVNVL